MPVPFSCQQINSAMSNNKMSVFSRVLCVVAAIALFISLFVPLWRIELNAPQYPEGLALMIYPNDIKGDVDIINGLNHYIGMQTLHTENFIEFKLLPYLIGFFVVLILLTGLIGRKKLLYVTLFLFIVFGIVAMVDFWRWEYDYGHNLDENAAIKVPGMAYQPPLIGFKQLLNFGAYSIPAIGGWLFIFCGILLLLGFVIEAKVYTLFKKVKHTVVLLFIPFVLFASCTAKGPEEINVNYDNCSYCKMTISDIKYAAEGITSKNRVYKFDDVICLVNFLAANKNINFSNIYVANFTDKSAWLNAQEAFFVKTTQLQSPMGGNCPAFESPENAQLFFNTTAVETFNFDKIN